ncbi:ATP-binding cassette domain-containing protein [Peteryoungia ipomoeae]|uniref:ATP-binding cassette domain-containing protein n=1 Tax=Peteryoungia ipomoeae TaxID=1210932 RepID=A0A4S8P0E1_9HYPH|nr:ATP-binding cassette domain-containing protein [Peteryoungia ipomoeae]THV20899.1 ATP-binding cassette domain-containing protein [Peteryoungia ipomoeae]
MNRQRSTFSLCNVGFDVAERPILAPLTLEIPLDGEVLGLIGHNGSGKSTLLKLLARQQAPSSGTIMLDGRPLDTWGDRSLARKIAYLAQHLPSAAGLTVRELVSLGRYPWHGALGRFGEVDRQKTEEAIAMTGVAPLADRLVDTLSGGERQRAWLAMLVAQDTECLLLDEPISALDIAHQIEVLTLIRKLSQEKGLGIIIVLHDINMASRFCDTITALHSGRMIIEGAPETIMTPGALQRIYGLPMDVMPHVPTGKFLAFAR